MVLISIFLLSESQPSAARSSGENQMKSKMEIFQLGWISLGSTLTLTLMSWYSVQFLSEHSLSTYFSQVLIYFPPSGRGEARTRDQVWALISQLWRGEKIWRNIGPALLEAAAALAEIKILRYFPLNLMMGEEKTISDFVSKVLWCEEDDLGAGARFHLVKTSYINKMGLEIRDKIDLCERFELWPHSLSWCGPL